MIRIWAKVMKKEKIISQTIFEEVGEFDIEKFYDYVSQICQSLDIATPIILSKHLFHYVQFNNTTFIPNDFPEVVNFDKFILEEASKY